MNKRIKELALRAGASYTTDQGWLNVNRNEILEHFAELIIKECASLCNNFDVYYADNSPLKREVALETAHDLADMILEHFGVSE